MIGEANIGFQSWPTARLRLQRLPRASNVSRDSPRILIPAQVGHREFAVVLDLFYSQISCHGQSEWPFVFSGSGRFRSGQPDSLAVGMGLEELTEEWFLMKAHFCTGP